MAALNFPINPNVNDTYTAGATTWLYDGTAWQIQLTVSGYTGSKGYTGSIGYTGSLGYSGSVGYTGSLGYTGSQGSQGIQGYTGSQGIQGNLGYTGSQGIIGYTGSQGIQGNIGYTGSQGIQGVIGYTGSLGYTGSQGIQGNLGYTGSQGTQGVIGYTGSQGIQGNLGYTGSKGDQGVIGYTGSQGIQGVIGYTGSLGYTGSQGIQGVIGYTGSQGIQGVIGYTGSQGIIGYTGSAGTAGGLGYTGSQGYTGSLGFVSYALKTTTYTAVAGDYLIAKTTGGSFTITLPATPATGAIVSISDGGAWATNNLTVARNGSTIEGIADDLLLDASGVTVDFIYDGTTWQVITTLGSQGAIGYTGSRGLIGYTGSASTVIGYTGSQGNIGYTGSASTVIGYTGSASTVIGYTGSQGAQGIIGYTGSSAPGVSAGSTSTGFVQYSGTTATSAQWNGGTTAPSGTTRLNYEGYLYATKLYGDGSSLSGITGGATITDDLATNTTQYLGMSRTTSGSWTAAYVATTKLYFNPSTGTLNATNFNSLSDALFKTNIKVISNGVEVVQQLQGVEFDWIDNGAKSSGVVAQQVEQVLPWLIETNKDGTKSVNYPGLIGYLIEAIKEQQHQIDDLRKTLNSQ